jgi:hypothetical protein
MRLYRKKISLHPQFKNIRNVLLNKAESNKLISIRKIFNASEFFCMNKSVLVDFLGQSQIDRLSVLG